MAKLEFVIAAIAVLSLLTPQARAADSCEAVALRDVSARENPEAILQTGRKDRGITQYSIEKKTRMTWFCSHGGVCYPADGLKLLNCTITRSKVFEDADETVYSVDTR